MHCMLTSIHTAFLYTLLHTHTELGTLAFAHTVPHVRSGRKGESHISGMCSKLRRLISITDQEGMISPDCPDDTECVMLTSRSQHMARNRV